ncbi:hypothetical protein FEM48_Zijuj10G0139600 [Ziziphus jujuba var. spinosa]|uniref:Uncharacterized protein n=1 Tax=Ziziphus jujuba var. spinosa TaxID=714518 RepID=A0A978UNS8_ZIZJJ|nr:hypothetical protein FEM48_Zijuj10G0139600 [Ziziphus jujuba var. spinosa]
MMVLEMVGGRKIVSIGAVHFGLHSAFYASNSENLCLLSTSFSPILCCLARLNNRDTLREAMVVKPSAQSFLRGKKGVSFNMDDEADLDLELLKFGIFAAAAA